MANQDFRPLLPVSLKISKIVVLSSEGPDECWLWTGSVVRDMDISLWAEV
jgi:hypothetical protein